MRIFFALFFLVFLSVSIASTSPATTRLPARVQMVLAKASKEVEKEHYDQAIAILEEFRSRGEGRLKSSFEHPAINMSLGNYLSLKERYEEAAKAYRRVVTRDEDNLPGWQNLGRAVYLQKKYQEASKYFLTAYGLSDPPDAQLFYYGAAAMLMAEKYQQAITLFEELITKHPEEIKLLWKESLVYALLAVNSNKRALVYIRELANGYQGKKQRQWREILLQQYLLLAMHQEAEALAMALTRLEPEETLWWKSLVHISLNQGRLEEALRALTIYRYLTPLEAEEKKLMADLHLQLGIPQQAVSDYKSYLAEKNDKKVVRRLVHAYLELGEGKAALELLRNSSLPQENGDLCTLEGEILYGLERYQEAEEAFRCAAKESNDKTVGRALLMLAYSHWQQQEMGESLAVFIRATEYKGVRSEAKKAISQLEKIMEKQEALVQGG